jgi:hypothetical protein
VAILTQAAIITCPHQSGIVTIVPKPNPILVGGVPALLLTDLIGCPIAGCPVTPPPAGPGPCLTVAAPPANWVGTTPVVYGTVPVLSANAGMVGGMTAGGTPGPLMLKFPGQMMVL